MNPTAHPNPPDANTPASPPDPIQPGQFVVAGEEDGVFKEPPAPGLETRPKIQNAPPLATSVQPKVAPSPQPVPPTQPLPGPTPQPVVVPSQPSQPTPQPPPQVTSAPALPEQPNPTPFVPPNVNPTPEVESPSSIKKTRLVIIGLGVLILIAAVAALAWFFVLSKSGTPSVQNSSQDVQIDQTTQPPGKPTGGFAAIPPATGSGTLQATPSATPGATSTPTPGP